MTFHVQAQLLGDNLLEIRGSNQQVLDAARKAGDGELLLKRKVSALLLAQLMQDVAITKIVCSQAIFERLPHSAVNALERMGVEISVEDVKRGRPEAHPREKLAMVSDLHGQGFGAAEISARLRLPLRTVYYHLNKKRF